MAALSAIIDTPYENEEFSDLADAPVVALQGMSAEQAEALQIAFNIRTIRDLATNQYVLVAQGVVALSAAARRASEDYDLQWLIDLVDIAAGVESPDAPTDVSTNKHKYLADAIYAEFATSEEQ